MSAAKKQKVKRGRPQDEIPKVTISFRVPSDVEDAVKEVADQEAAKTPGRSVKPSDIYNQALAEFLARRKYLIPGWNAPAE